MTNEEHIERDGEKWKVEVQKERDGNLQSYAMFASLSLLMLSFSAELVAAILLIAAIVCIVRLFSRRKCAIINSNLGLAVLSGIWTVMGAWRIINHLCEK